MSDTAAIARNSAVHETKMQAERKRARPASHRTLSHHIDMLLSARQNGKAYTAHAGKTSLSSSFADKGGRRRRVNSASVPPLQVSHLEEQHYTATPIVVVFYDIGFLYILHSFPIITYCRLRMCSHSLESVRSCSHAT